MQKAFITGLAGLALSSDERSFLAEHRPAGIILFSRNIADREQIRQLVCDAVAAIGTGRTLVLVDQEGGRVQRIRPPNAHRLPPAAALAAMHAVDPAGAIETARAVARLCAEDLVALGINCNCAPVLDVPVPGAHDIIGDRAYGATPDRIVALGRAVAEGLASGGVVPVMKHIPGHGRATADSHLELPVVAAGLDELARSDFVPFARLADLPAAMTAHVVFSSIDPDHPASTSATVIRDLIRQRIGFRGLLMSDDLSMKALTGTLAGRTRAVLDAGSDLALHCNGDIDEMREVAGIAPWLSGASLARLDRALAVTSAPPGFFDRAAAHAVLTQILSKTA
jgi:beta-N-acetylhexosaminidase